MAKNFCVGSNKFLTLDKYSTSPTLGLLLGKIFGVDFVKKKKVIKYVFFYLRLQVYRYLTPLRLLVCGGDGSVGWVLKEIDSLQLKVGYIKNSN